MHGFMRSNGNQHKVPERWVEAVLSSAAVVLSAERFDRLKTLPDSVLQAVGAQYGILGITTLDPWSTEQQVCCTRLKDQSILAMRKHRASYTHVRAVLFAGLTTGVFQTPELEPAFQKYLASTFMPEDLLAFQSTLALVHAR